jgi:hypothetical protein
MSFVRFKCVQSSETEFQLCPTPKPNVLRRQSSRNVLKNGMQSDGDWKQSSRLVPDEGYKSLSVPTPPTLGFTFDSIHQALSSMSIPTWSTISYGKDSMPKCPRASSWSCSNNISREPLQHIIHSERPCQQTANQQRLEYDPSLMFLNDAN